MLILDIAKTAFSSLMANKLRSSLTVLGIVIGVTSVISLMSIGKGAQRSITQSIEGIGTNLLFVRPNFANEGRAQGAAGATITLTYEDAQALSDASAAPAISGVAPQAQGGGQIVAGGQNTFAQIMGVTPDFINVLNRNIAEGEFITDSDLQARTNVVVLGSSIAKTLFPDSEAVGETVRISQRPFQITGVMQPIGGTTTGTQDNVVYVPLTTYQTRLSSQRTSQGRNSVQLINVKASDANSIDAAKAQIAQVLRDRHRVVLGASDDFTITSQEDVIQTRTQVVNVFTIFLGAISGISLLVGGIGVMNIMLVSVAERTREIGIRKALGAKRRDIMMQFLIEAIFLSLIGGLIGVALGLSTSGLVEKISLNNQTLTTAVTPDIIILAVSVSAFIGIFFGIYPASRASRLDPIVALRHD